jgi:hypothetical protein
MACFVLFLSFFTACTNEEGKVSPPKVAKKDPVEKKVEPEIPQPAFTYHFISLKAKDKALRDSSLAIMKAFTPAERDIVLRLNRVDAASYKRLDTMIVPDKIDTSWMAYSIFPAELPIIKDVPKMVFFSYYGEAFAAYESGRLVKWGPSNMGKKATQLESTGNDQHG